MDVTQDPEWKVTCHPPSHTQSQSWARAELVVTNTTSIITGQNNTWNNSITFPHAAFEHESDIRANLVNSL